MRRRHLSKILAAVLALHAAACVSSDPPVSAAFDPLVAFPAQATYVWDEEANVLPKDLHGQQLEVGPIIQGLATEAMAKRGYTQAVTGTPPFRMSYQLLTHTWISQQHSSSTASLALRMGDYLSDKTVWKGFTRIEVQLGRPVEERRRILRETIDRMLENFPPGHGG